MVHLACCSDTHDGLPPAIDLASIAAWLHAGDVYEGPDHALVAEAPAGDWLRRKDWKKGEPLRQWTAEQAAPIYAVRGNHDCADYWKIFDSWQDVGGRIVQLADRLFVAGIGWHGEKYFDTPAESDLEPVCEMILRQARRLVMPRDSLVLLTHYPALLPGMFPASGGVDAFVCIRRLIEELAPIAVVQGHVHEWFGQTHVVQMSGRPVLLLNPGPLGDILQIDMDAGRASYTATGG